LEGAVFENITKGDMGGFPNGVYKVTLGFYDELDEKILLFIFFLENVFHSRIAAGQYF
jgi:hypothetical protein